MKRCPQCSREYDNSMSFCLDDGAELLYGPASSDGPDTAILPPTDQADEARTRAQLHTTDEIVTPKPEERLSTRHVGFRTAVLIALVPLIVFIAIFGYRYMQAGAAPGHLNSIAVLPFENRSGSTDTDYLSDGLTDS